MRFKRYLSKIKIIILLCFIFLILVATGLVKEIVNRRYIDNEISNLKNQIILSEQENLEIISLISEWKKGNRLEKEARIKLGLQKPGEKVVLISREDLNPGVLGERDKINKNSKILGNIIKREKNSDQWSNLKKWFDYFLIKTKK